MSEQELHYLIRISIKELRNETMKIDADIEQVKSDVTEKKMRMKAYRKSDKRKSAFVAVYMGVVSAITTICIGIVSFLPDIYSNSFGIASLLTSASLTVLLAWDGIFNHKKLWINSAKAFDELDELDLDIRHVEASSSEVSQDQTNEFYERYKSIMKDNNERWYRMRE